MKSLSSVGLALSIIFGCLVLALFAELYYLLWWKRRLITNKEIGDDYTSPAREMFYMLCLKGRSSSSRHCQDVCSSVRITDTLVHHEQGDQSQAQLYLDGINTSKDLFLKPFGDDEYSMETDQLTLLHNLSGPPRFLFTIVEETKEDLESEDGGKSRGDNKSAKGSRSRSLSDLLLTVESTPYLTPLASPPFFTPPLTPACNYQYGFNHLFESLTDAEFNKMRASPPPKFKFLQDAEEKLSRRKLAEEEEEAAAADQIKVQKNNGLFAQDEEDGPFITIIVDRNKERELDYQHHQLQAQYHSSTSQNKAGQVQVNGGSCGVTTCIRHSPYLLELS